MSESRHLVNRPLSVALHPAVREVLCGEAAGEPWAVACSGGADSVFLLHAVWETFPEARDRLTVLHFNHRLRGAESDGDAAFVAALGAELGLPVVSGVWERPAEAPLHEAAMRDARLAFFRKVLEETGGRVLLFGHHLGDVAETLLMRLGRGSGTDGLAAPRPVSRHPGLDPVGAAENERAVLFLRPLLHLEKASIIESLTASGHSWREDASNAAPDFERNRLRQSVLPHLKEALGHDFAHGAARSRELLEEDTVALNAWLDDLLPPSATASIRLDTAPLAGKPQALWRRVLHRWLGANSAAGAFSRAAFEDLLGGVVAGRAFRMSAGNAPSGRARFVVFQAPELAIETAAVSSGEWPPVALMPGAAVIFPDGSQLEMRPRELDDDLRNAVMAGHFDPGKTVFLDAASLPPGGFTVRLWQPGDRYQPLGAPGHKKLQDAFTDLKIPRAERTRLPVVVDATGDILWAPGLIPAEKARIKPRSEDSLQLTYRKLSATLDDLR